MRSAYRIPNNAGASSEPSKPPASVVPIGRFNVRSFLTNIADGATVAAGEELALRGIAFDGGYGISDVAVSADGGTTWMEAVLGENVGKYSFAPPIAPASRSRSNLSGTQQAICAKSPKLSAG